MSNEEEDIIFEGSPLAQHLQNVGVEFEAVSSGKDKLEEELKVAKNEPVENIVWEAERTSIVDQKYRKQCMILILESGLLKREDKVLLKEFMDVFGCRAVCLTPTLKRGTFDALMIAAVLTGWRCGLPKPVMLLTTGIPLVVLWRWRSVWSLPRQTAKLKSLLEAAKKLDENIRKALQRIGECSVISQGYLLLTRNHPALRVERTDISEVFNQSQGSLPGLRKALLEICKRLSSVLVEATRELKQRRPLPHSLDHDDLYISGIEEDLFPYLGNVLPTVEKLRLAVNRQVLLMSQYMKRLFLHVVFTSDSPLNLMLNTALENEIVQCSQLMESVLVTYGPYVASLTNPRDLTSSQPQSGVRELEVSCHSTSIHIQEALLNSQDVEVMVKKTSDIKNIDLKRVDELNHKIKYHLKCASLCIERSEIVCGRGFTKDSSDPAPIPSIPEIRADIPLERLPIRSEERVDVAPCDEVFELYDRGEQGKSVDVSEEEVARPKDDAMVLQELKNVLAVKAADWKERERAARRQRLGDFQDLSGFESDVEDDAERESNIECEEERGKKIEVAMEEVLEEAASSIQNQTSKNVICESSETLGSSAVGIVAAEAVAKARSQLSGGLLSNVQCYGCSDSEESEG